MKLGQSGIIGMATALFPAGITFAAGTFETAGMSFTSDGEFSYK